LQSLAARCRSLERSSYCPSSATGDWDELPQARRLTFDQLPFAHPLWVSTRRADCLPRRSSTAGGILLEHLKKLHLPMTPGRATSLLFTTTADDVDLLVGCLFTEAAIVLFRRPSPAIRS